MKENPKARSWLALGGAAGIAWLVEAALRTLSAPGATSFGAAVLDTSAATWARRAILAGVLLVCTWLASRAFRTQISTGNGDISPELAARVFENTIEGVVVTDPDGTIRMVNPAFTAITGYSADEVIGENPRILKSDRHGHEFYRQMWQAITEHGQWSGEIWNRNKAGEAYPEWLTISAVKDVEGRTTHYVSVFHDLSDIFRRHETIRHLAYHDALTGLPNRLLLDDRLTQALAHARRSGSWVAALFFDLDDFKEVNDRLGHIAGDRVLQIVAERLQGRIREQDTVARHGGDEFVVVASDLGSPEDARRLAELLTTAIAQPMQVEGETLRVGASIGIAMYPGSGSTPDALIAEADRAMYRAKARGSGSIEVSSRGTGGTTSS